MYVCMQVYDTEETRRVAYRGVVETSSAVVARQSRTVDNLVFTAGTCEARSAVALVAAKTNVTTDSSVETRMMRCTVIQVYSQPRSVCKIRLMSDTVKMHLS